MVIYDDVSNTIIVNFLVSGYPDSTDKAYLTQAIVEFVKGKVMVMEAQLYQTE